MIGQGILRESIDYMIKNRTFPRFTILVGPRGSGKKTLATEIKEMFNSYRVSSDYVYAYRVPDVKIDTIRSIIKQAYKTVTTAIYIIPDADSMSIAAKNALLKVTEEPPNEAYFIMTLEDENNTLETIKSRGTVFHMERYALDELELFWDNSNYFKDITSTHKKIALDVCDTPGDVIDICKINIKNFIDYVQLVVDNIADVSIANALKIGEKVALNDKGDKRYDLRLFWKMFQKLVFVSAVSNTSKFDMGKTLTVIRLTSMSLQNLRIKGINKQMLFDNWLLEVRDVWS